MATKDGKNILLLQLNDENSFELYQRLCLTLLRLDDLCEVSSIRIILRSGVFVGKPLAELMTNSRHHLCNMPEIFCCEANNRDSQYSVGEGNEINADSVAGTPEEMAFVSCFLLSTVYDLHRLDSWVRTLRRLKRIYDTQGYLRIIETGISRDNSSTDVFALLASRLPNVTIETHDIDQVLCRLARSRYTELISKSKLLVREGDSVVELGKIVNLPPPNCLYLDSYDLDFDYPEPSSIHHLMEFLRLENVMSQVETLLVVDDTPLTFEYICEYHQRRDYCISGELENDVRDLHVPGKGMAILSYLLGKSYRWDVSEIFHSYQLNMLLKMKA